MSTIKDKMGREAFSVGFEYAYSKLEKDLKQGAADLLNLAEKYISKGDTAIPIDEIKEAMKDSNGVLFSFLDRAMTELDKDLLKTLFLNAVYEIAISGRKKIHEKEDELGVKVPRFILMEPVVGNYNLAYDDMDRIVKQGQELGIFLYFLTGGEPLLRRDDIMKLCSENPRSNFMCFTDGTLVDEKLGEEIKKVGNIVPIIALEELEEKTTEERGPGVWDKVMEGLSALKNSKVLFGTSVCYTSANYEKAVSSDFIAMERDRGVKFSMYSNYTPITINDDPALMLDPEQRHTVLKRIREIRDFKDGDGMFAFDFQKDAEYLGGSISGGRTYLHINPKGDVVTSTLMNEIGGNIHEGSLVDIIKKPDVLAYLEPVDRLSKRRID